MRSGPQATNRFNAAADKREATGVGGNRMARPQPSLWPLGIVCGISGIAAWILYLWAFHGDPGQDWMVFYTAARAYLDGNLPLIFDGQQLTAALNHRFAGWMLIALNLHH